MFINSFFMVQRCIKYSISQEVIVDCHQGPLIKVIFECLVNEQKSFVTQHINTIDCAVFYPTIFTSAYSILLRNRKLFVNLRTINHMQHLELFSIKRSWYKG